METSRELKASALSLLCFSDEAHAPTSLPSSSLPCLCFFQNLVVAVSAEGWFYLCDLTPAKALDASGHHESLTAEEQHPVFKQHIPANTKVMLISDIGGHGRLQAAGGIGVNG